MIARLTGVLASRRPGAVVVDVSGVGYELRIPLSAYYNLPDEGSLVTLHVHTHVREDEISLYGFPAPREKSLFLMLMGVSGVGPKLALNIISGLPYDTLVDAMIRGDERAVSSIPGVGKKTAARLVLELADKVAALGVQAAHAGPCAVGTASVPAREEVVSALVNLGYKRAVAEDAVKKVCAATGEDMPIESLIKETLKALAKG